MRHLLTLAIICLATSAHAAQQVRDLSLSVQDTFNQKSVPTTPFVEKVTTPTSSPDTGFDSGVQMDPNMAKQMQDINQRNITTNKAGSFMANFCSASNNCKSTQQQQACDRFHRTTVDIQRLLERAIDCEMNPVANNDMSDSCDGIDAGRLDQLKQYWQDEDSAYTLLFLPEMVQNAAAKCAVPNAAPNSPNGFRE